MSAKSPGQRIAANKPSVLSIAPLDDDDIVTALTTLYDLLMTSRGPQGQVKVIHNNCGGEVTLTSDCDRLIVSLTSTKPVIKLITSAIKDHNRLYCDGGLLSAVLSLKLITSALRTNIHRRLISEIYDTTLKECMKIIESKQFPCKIDVASAPNVYERLIRSMYTSKPSCLLFDSDLEHMCKLSLDAFKQSRSSGKSTGTDSLLFATVEGKPVQDSKLLAGVFYQCPEIPTYNRRPLSVKTNDGVISTALIQTTMAGDSEAFLDVTYEMTPDLNLSAAVLSQLTKFTEVIIQDGVGVVLCQKVINPTVKRMLKQQGVLVLDRLGVALFTAVHKLTGGLVLDPFSKSDQWYLTSQLGSVQHIVINKKSYLHLEGVPTRASAVHTVLLCHRTKQALNEMKGVYERCQHVLFLTNKTGMVLCGAGCWQTALTLQLSAKLSSLSEQWCHTLGCSKLQVSEILEIFLTALSHTAMTSDQTDTYNHVVDKASGHHFMLENSTDCIPRCQCGGVTYSSSHKMNYAFLQSKDLRGLIFGRDISEIDEHPDNYCAEEVRVVDGYLPVVNALKTAVAISCMVLGIHNYIQDVN